MIGSDDEEVQQPIRQKRKNRSKKLHIVFDEEKRREFLTGFHKRKVQRRKVAEDDFKKQLKEEKKRIKLESKEQYKKMVQSYKPIPELEEQLADEYEIDDSKVSVLELDTDLLAKTNFIIGRNRTVYEEPEIKEEKVEPKEVNFGMEIKGKKDLVIKCKKDVMKELKKNATKKLQKSKVFQKKNKMERQKQKKKSLKIKKEKLKIKTKGGKPPKSNKRQKFKK